MELIFPNFFILIFIFVLISQKITCKMSPKLFSQILKFQEGGVYLQIRSLVHITFFEIEKIEKTTNLHYNLCVCFILDHIHFVIGTLFLRGRMNGFTTSLLSIKIDTCEFSFCLPALQDCSFCKQWIKSSSVPSIARLKPQHLNDFIMFSLDS